MANSLPPPFLTINKKECHRWHFIYYHYIITFFHCQIKIFTAILISLWLNYGELEVMLNLG